MNHDLKEVYKNHKITREKTDSTEIITFKNPQSSHYWIRFLFTNRFMIIVGDLGEAIFEFSELINFDRIIEYKDYHYMMSKYNSSNRERYDFDEKKFLSDFSQLEEDFLDSYGEDLSSDISGALKTLKRIGENASDYNDYQDELKSNIGELYCLCDDYSYFSFGRIDNPIFKLYYDTLFYINEILTIKERDILNQKKRIEKQIKDIQELCVNDEMCENYLSEMNGLFDELKKIEAQLKELIKNETNNI